MTTLPCSAQHDITNTVTGLKYRIQVSWPLNLAKAKDTQDVLPVMYILDGNTLFLTASEVLWRRGTSSSLGPGCIIVAIGYQNDPELTGSLYDNQRGFDLTLPKPKDVPDAFGGADHFLDFINKQVKQLVKTEFPYITIGHEAIFGHSFGGMCALHTLFTRETMFDMYFVASPSIWWDPETLLNEEERYSACEGLKKERKRRYLDISFGTLEQEPRKRTRETVEDFKERAKIIEERAMGANAVAMHKRLARSGLLGEVTSKEFQDEDHGSVATCALLRALTGLCEHEETEK